MKRPDATTLRRIAYAISFWFDTEEADIRRATRSDALTNEALKQKYARLKTKMKPTRTPE